MRGLARSRRTGRVVSRRPARRAWPSEPVKTKAPLRASRLEQCSQGRWRIHTITAWWRSGCSLTLSHRLESLRPSGSLDRRVFASGRARMLCQIGLNGLPGTRQLFLPFVLAQARHTSLPSPRLSPWHQTPQHDPPHTTSLLMLYVPACWIRFPFLLLCLSHASHLFPVSFY